MFNFLGGLNGNFSENIRTFSDNFSKIRHKQNTGNTKKIGLYIFYMELNPT